MRFPRAVHFCPDQKAKQDAGFGDQLADCSSEACILNPSFGVTASPFFWANFRLSVCKKFGKWFQSKPKCQLVVIFLHSDLVILLLQHCVFIWMEALDERGQILPLAIKC